MGFEVGNGRGFSWEMEGDLSGRWEGFGVRDGRVLSRIDGGSM